MCSTRPLRAIAVSLRTHPAQTIRQSLAEDTSPSPRKGTPLLDLCRPRLVREDLSAREGQLRLLPDLRVSRRTGHPSIRRCRARTGQGLAWKMVRTLLGSAVLRARYRYAFRCSSVAATASLRWTSRRTRMLGQARVDMVARVSKVRIEESYSEARQLRDLQ